MQDASFIEDPGEYSKPRGDNAVTRRSKDGTFATKNKEKHFGYKVHTLADSYKIIEKLAVTTASTHDSQIDLSLPGIICYRDKGYFGSDCRGIDGTMDRSWKDHPYAFMKRIFHFDRTMVTTVQRNRDKAHFTAICYNLVRARFLDTIAVAM